VKEVEMTKEKSERVMTGEQDDYASHSALIHRVRLEVGGKTALFVSNRPDPKLEQVLEEALGVDLDWCEHRPRRVQAAAERIRHRRYGLIIVATGFVGHDVDQILSRAAGSVGVPYIRADRGRVLGTIRAIARVTGLVRGEAGDHEA
jgi:hypothetical protein